MSFNCLTIYLHCDWVFFCIILNCNCLLKQIGSFVFDIWCLGIKVLHDLNENKSN